LYQSLYLPRNTPVHTLDPRVKIVGLVVLSALPFVFNNPAYTAVIVGMVLLVTILGRCLGQVFRFRRLYLLFFVITVVVWQFYITGAEVLLSVGPVHLSRESLLYGLAAGLRFVVVLMVGMLFVSCTTTEELTVGLTALRLPFTVAFVVSTTARLVPTFVSAAGLVLEAQAARGFTADSRNPFRRARQLLPVTVPLIMYALRHASLMSLAIEARGFSTGARRTRYAEPTLTRRDVIVLFGLLLALAGALALRFTGHGAVLPHRI
jgi:energy-coupling factor transport system permease protein